MQRENVTVALFSKWSFENDLAEGLFEHDDDMKGVAELSSAPAEVREVYETEANAYLKSKNDWPVNILVRLSEEK
jgi:hypothetical protein